MQPFLISLLENLAYDLGKGLLLSGASLFVLRKAFGVLKKRKEAIYFWGGGTLIVALGLLFASPVMPNAPQFDGTILIGHGGKFTPGPGATPPNGARIVVFGSFINSGQMPSILYNWELTAEMNDKTYTGEPSEIGQFSMTRNGKMITFFPDDALYERALAPVPVGGMVQGILTFVFPNLDQDAFPEGTKFTLTFLDAVGHKYIHVVTSTGDPGPFGYIPGLHQEFSTPTASPSP